MIRPILAGETTLLGLADDTLLWLVGEVGTDLARWKSEKQR